MRKAVIRQGLAFTLLLAPALAAGQPISDTFEASALNPDWVVVQQQLGSVTLSTEQNQTPGGSQSLKLASVSGGQRNMIVRRYFGAPTRGRVSIDVYDAAPGQQTLYVNFLLVNTTARTVASLGMRDYDAFCYSAFTYLQGADVNLGPNQPCGVFPGTETTSVARTAGWHRFTIDVGVDTTKFSIDSTIVYTFPGSFSFDMVQLDLSGPGFRPNTVVYFDNFTFAPLALCDIQLSSLVHENGSVVSVPVFRLANNTAGPLGTEIKSWLSVPGVPPVSIINAGADGSVVLPAAFDVNLGPFNLLPVTASTPRGGYELGCRVLDPKTGATLARGSAPFVVR